MPSKNLALTLDTLVFGFLGDTLLKHAEHHRDNKNLKRREL